MVGKGNSRIEMLRTIIKAQIIVLAGVKLSGKGVFMVAVMLLYTKRSDQAKGKGKVRLGV